MGKNRCSNGYMYIYIYRDAENGAMLEYIYGDVGGMD